MVGRAIGIVRRWRGGALGAAVTLALGVGVSAGVFSFLQSMVAPPLRGDLAQDTARLVRVPVLHTRAAYRGLVDGVQTLDMGVYLRVTGGVGRGPSGAPLQLECISQSYLRLLGVRPLIGRIFEAHEDVEDGAPLLLLAHGFWTRRFGADPAVVGSAVEVNERRYTVIGVAPRGFGGVESRGVGVPAADAWTLLATSPVQCVGHDDWELIGLSVIGRIREPYTLGQAAGEMSSYRAVIEDLNGQYFQTGNGIPVVPLYDRRYGASSPEWQILRWIGAGAAVGLLLVCANVSVLLLLGVARRRDEMVVRLQLGARRRQIFMQVLGEALLLGAWCAIPAVAMGAWTAMLMEALVPVGSMDDFLGPRGLGTVAVLALGASLFSGVAPALAAARISVNMTRVGGAGSRTKQRALVGDVLLAGQVAAALVLMMTAWLFVRSASAATRNVGYDLERVIVASMDLQRTGFDTLRARSVFDLLRRRVQRVPTVVSTALGSDALLDFRSTKQPLQLPGVDDGLMVQTADVTPSYFETLGTRIVRGRGFESENLAGAAPAMIVSEGLAQRLWPNGDALGSCAFVGVPNPVCREVVGISEARRAQEVTIVDEEIFMPLPRTIKPRVLLVRTGTSARAAMGAVAVAIRAADPDLPFVDVRPLTDLADEQTRTVRLAGTMGNLLGIIAVALAGIGIYGALVVSMRERIPEFGIRMALGARRGDVAWLIIRRGLAILAAGWIAGGVMIATAAPLVVASLFGVTALDLISFLVASGMVGLSVLIGVIVPAARAARLDPARALRI